MKLKATLSSLGEVDKAFQALYEQSGDIYILTGVEEKDYKTKLEGFRANNISMTKDLEALKGIDAEKYTQMQNQIRSIEEDKLREAGKFDELHTKQANDLAEKYEGLLNQASTIAAAKEKELNEYKAAVNKSAVNAAITHFVTEKATVRQGALPDILHRAADTFTADANGALKAKDGSNLQAKDWAESLVTSAPFFFEQSSGGGATGGAPDATPVGTIKASDKDAFSNNLEAIANGTIEVI